MLKEMEDEVLEIGDVGPRPLTGTSSLCPLVGGMMKKLNQLWRRNKQIQ